MVRLERVGLYVAVEGLSFTGKTTLTNYLAQRLGAERWAELSETHLSDAVWPAFPRDDAEARASDLWFLDRECERSQAAILNADQQVILADRCFVSSLAFAWARQQVYQLGSYNFVRSQLVERLHSRAIHFPWIVHLKGDVATLQARRECALAERILRIGASAVAKVVLEEATRIAFWQSLIRFYDLFVQLNVDRTFVLDCRLATARLAQEVAAWIAGLPQRYPTIDNISDRIPCAEL